MSTSGAGSPSLSPATATPAAAAAPATAADWRPDVDAQVAAYLARVAPYERVVPEYELLAREAASLRRVVADQEAQLSELRAVAAAAAARTASTRTPAATAGAADRRALEELQRRYYEAKDEVAALRGREVEGLRERLGLSRDNARLKEDAAAAAAAADEARAALDAAAADVRRLTAVACERDHLAREVARLAAHSAALAGELQAREVYIAQVGASAVASLNDMTASCEAAAAERDAALRREGAAVRRVADLEQQLAQLQHLACVLPQSHVDTATISPRFAPTSPRIIATLASVDSSHLYAYAPWPNAAAASPQEMATSALSSARSAVTSVLRSFVAAPSAPAPASSPSSAIASSTHAQPAQAYAAAAGRGAVLDVVDTRVRTPTTGTASAGSVTTAATPRPVGTTILGSGSSLTHSLSTQHIGTGRSDGAATAAVEDGSDWVHLHPAVATAKLPLTPGHVFRLTAASGSSSGGGGGGGGGGRAPAAYGLRFHESCALLAVAAGADGGGPDGGGCVQLFSVTQPSRPPTRLRVDGGGAGSVSPGPSRTGRPTPPSPTSPPTDVLCVDIAGRTVVGGCRAGGVAVWGLDGGGGRLACVLAGHTGAVAAVAYRPPSPALGDGLIASGSVDGTVRLWDARAGTAACAVDTRSPGVHGVALSPDGRLLAAATAASGVLLLDVRRPDTPLLVRQLPPARPAPAGDAFDGGATLAPFHTGAVLAVTFAPRSPEPLLLTCGADNTARLLYGHALAPVTVAAPTTAAVVGASGRNGEPAAASPLVMRHMRYEAPSASRAAVAWSPDGRYAVAGGRNGYVYAYDVTRDGGACAAELGSARDARRRVKAAAAASAAGAGTAVASPTDQGAASPLLRSQPHHLTTTTTTAISSSRRTAAGGGTCATAAGGGGVSSLDGGGGGGRGLAASAVSGGSSRGMSTTTTGDEGGGDASPLGRSQQRAAATGDSPPARSPASLSSSGLSTPTTTGIRFDPPHGGRPVLGVDWSSDGRWLASCDDAGAVVLWPAS